MTGGFSVFLVSPGSGDEKTLGCGQVMAHLRGCGKLERPAPRKRNLHKAGFPGTAEQFAGLHRLVFALVMQVSVCF